VDGPSAAARVRVTVTFARARALAVHSQRGQWRRRRTG